MHKYWSKVCDEWVYEIKGREIFHEKDPSPDELNLIIMTRTPNHEIAHSVSLEGNRFDDIVHTIRPMDYWGQY